MLKKIHKPTSKTECCSTYQNIFFYVILWSTATGRWMNYACLLSIIGIILCNTISGFRIRKDFNLILWGSLFGFFSIIDYTVRCSTGAELYLILSYLSFIVYSIFSEKTVYGFEVMCLLLNVFSVIQAIGILMQRYLYGIYIKFAYHILGYAGGRESGFVTDYSLAGYAMAIGIIVAWYSIKNKKIRNIICVLCFWSLMVTTKRSHTLILTVGILIVEYIMERYKAKALLRIIGVAVVFLLVGMIVYNIWGTDNAIGRLFNSLMQYCSGTDVNEISNNRIEIYDQTIELWKSSYRTICIGNGWGNFKNLFTRFNGIATAHNVFLQLLCENGIIGLSCFAFVMIASLLRSIKNLLCFKSGKYKGLSVICFYIQFHFCVYCFLGSPLYDTVCLIYYIFAVCGASFLSKIRSAKFL